ncbi:MAG: cupin domain-containing protein [Paracoccus sp. (in: a-proteobacteria)]|nr:cupin domain-containing protein [Paracoccus sp. (in: a-proteobacteria)]
MSIKKFGTYKTPNVEPITTDLDWWHPVEGSPTMRTWIEYQSEDGNFLSGFWEATPGTYKVKYEVDEFIHLFEGRVVLTDKGKEPQTFVAGDTFLIEAGFDGTWKTEETVRKTLAMRKR